MDDEEKIVFGHFGSKKQEPEEAPADPSKVKTLLEELIKDDQIGSILVFYTKPGSSEGKLKYEVNVANVSQSNLFVMNRYLERLVDKTIFG
jgi:hypothetical protein